VCGIVAVDGATVRVEADGNACGVKSGGGNRGDNAAADDPDPSPARRFGCIGKARLATGEGGRKPMGVMAVIRLLCSGDGTTLVAPLLLSWRFGSKGRAGVNMTTGLCEGTTILGLDGTAMRGLFANPKTCVVDIVTADNSLTGVGIDIDIDVDGAGIGTGGTGGRDDGVRAAGCECEDGNGGGGG
jgi:hypothetical protein